MTRAKKTTGDTITISRAEYDKLQRDKYGTCDLDPGQHIFKPGDEDFETYGGAEAYDVAVLVRVLDSGSWIRYNLKKTGWVQEVRNLVIQKGKRPAAGVGAYRQRRLEIMKYHRGADYVADNKALDRLTPKAAMADVVNQFAG